MRNPKFVACLFVIDGDMRPRKREVTLLPHVDVSSSASQIGANVAKRGYTMVIRRFISLELIRCLLAVEILTGLDDGNCFKDRFRMVLVLVFSFL